MNRHKMPSLYLGGYITPREKIFFSEKIFFDFTSLKGLDKRRYLERYCLLEQGNLVLQACFIHECEEFHYSSTLLVKAVRLPFGFNLRVCDF